MQTNTCFGEVIAKILVTEPWSGKVNSEDYVKCMQRAEQVGKNGV